MVKGLLSQTMEMAMGTLNFKRGVVATTASICIGMGIKPQKSPTATPRVTERLLMPKNDFGSLYLSRKASSLPFSADLFLKTFRIIALRVPHFVLLLV